MRHTGGMRIGGVSRRALVGAGLAEAVGCSGRRYYRFDKLYRAVRVPLSGGAAIFHLLVTEGRRSRFSSGSYGLDLQAHRMRDAERVGLYTLANDGDYTVLRNSRLLGFDGKTLWAFTTTLLAIEPETGRFREITGDWLKESQYFNWDDRSQRFRFTAADGRRMVFNPTTNRHDPEPPGPNGQPLHTFWPGMVMDAWWVLGTYSDTGTWFGLMAEPEQRSWVPGVGKRFGEPVSQGLEIPRQLYRVQMRPDEDGNRQVTAMETAGSYLQGRLLTTGRHKEALRLRDPDGYLIMHWSRVGNEGSVRLTRVTPEGKALWTADTGIHRVTEVHADPAVVMVIGASPEPAGQQMALEQIASVATADGVVHRGSFLLP